MPIPEVKSGERQNDFLSRCIGAIYGEKPKAQVIAICYSKWRESKK